MLEFVTASEDIRAESAMSLPVVLLKEASWPVITLAGPTTTEATTTPESSSAFVTVDHMAMFPVVCAPEMLVMLSTKREFTAPEIEPMFVMLFVAIAIAPDIVPPDLSR